MPDYAKCFLGQHCPLGGLPRQAPRERVSGENLLVLMVFSKVVQVWWPEGGSLLTCWNLTYLEALCV